MLLGWLGLFAGVVGLLGSAAATIGGYAYSVTSAIDGQQTVALVSALIGVAGNMGAALLTVYLTRSWRR